MYTYQGRYTFISKGIPISMPLYICETKHEFILVASVYIFKFIHCVGILISPFQPEASVLRIRLSP